MRTKVLAPIADVVRVLPDVFNLAPDTDYNRFISHSVRELNEKTAVMTGKQMRQAMTTVMKRLPTDITR